jgi:hypothetical protein
MHVDPFSSGIADVASPVDRRRHLEALAGGLKSIYMLHAGEDLVVQFASWLSGAFDGMEAELREFAEEHVLRSGRSSASVTHLAHQASVSRELLGLRHLDSFSQYGTDDRWPADSESTDSVSSTPSLGLLAYAASIVEGMTMWRSVQQSRDAAIAVVSAMPLDRLAQITPAMLLALPAETLPELAPAVLLAVPSNQITKVLQGALKLLPPDVAPDVVSAVVAALQANEPAIL